MSYRLTFSLASLIFLIALGLILVPTSVMAHSAAQLAGADGIAGNDDDVPPHSHPVKVLVPAVTGDNPAAEIPVHGHHPMVEVTLEGGGTEAVVTSTAANVNLIVQFDMPTIAGATVGTTTAVNATLTADLLTAASFSFAIRDNSGASPATGNLITNTFSGGTVDLTLGTVVRSEPTAGTKFVVPLTIPTEAIPTGMADADNEKFHLIIRVNRGAGYGLQKTLPNDDPVLDDIDVAGSESQASMTKTFTLVKTLTPAPMAPGEPTGVMTTVSDDKSSITVSWTAPTDMGNPNLTGYKVTKSYMAADGAATVEKMTDADTTMATFGSADEPLARDTAFTFSVVAVNSEGDSPAGMSAPVTIASPLPAPFFPAGSSIDAIKIWAGHPYVSPVLPRARAAEGVDYLYKVRVKEGSNAGDPQQLPGGFELLNDDVENRTLEIREANKADSVAMAKTTYEYIAYNIEEPTSESPKPIEFTIEVVKQTVPTAPTMVMAAEEGLTEDPLDRMINNNRVVVNWEAPVNDPDYLATFSAPHNTIHFGSPITHYEVIQTGKITAGNPTGTPDAMYPADDPNTMKIDGKHTRKLAADNTSYITPELASQSMSSNGLGVYEYQVRAVNGEGTGPSNKVDDASTALVLNPPNQPGDLRDAKEGTLDGSVILNWLPVTNEGDADGGVDDGLVTQYRITVIKPDGETDRDETADDLEHQIEGLTAGRHVFRVAGVNSDGVGRESVSTTFDVQVDPGASGNNDPVFAIDAKIDNIVAMADEQIDPLILPEATDVDKDDILTYSIENRNGVPVRNPGGLTFISEDRALHGTPTAAMGPTLYRYKVSDGNGGSDTISFFITVKAAAPLTGGGTVTASLPAKGFVVYVRDLSNAPHFGTSSPMVAEWSGMPNLEELFSEGGGGSLQLTVAGVNARQVVFSEVMWAIDEGKVGQDSYTGQQWIEIYNRTDTAVALSSISFLTQSGRPALAQNTDLISNVVGGGSDWIKQGKGQNGNTGAGDGSGQKEFRSMYRKRFHNDSAGWSAGEWLEATQVYHPNFKGTPGTAEPKAPTTFPESPVALGTVFNEISNSSNSAHEWIELRKRDGELTNLENWVVHIVTSASDRAATANPTQRKLFQIPKLNDGRYGNILLITRTDPARDDSHPLRGGYNVEVADEDQANEGRDKNIRYYVADDWTINLPDNGEFVLILRHGADKTNHEKVQDVAGYHPNLKVDRADFFSNLWPLRGFPAPGASGWTQNKLGAGTVHRRQHDGIAGTKRSRTDRGNNADDGAFRDVGWTGIGYKRNADAGAKNGGTPGYPNNALQSNETEASGDPVIISEIMYATGDRGNMPQWIELRNTSQTVGVNLDGWRVTIVNHDLDNADGTTYPDDLVKQYNINGKIPPGQTFLITAHSGTDNTNLPSERIVSIRNRRGELILSQYGFEITLETKGKDNNDANRKEADKVGNLAAGADARVRGNPQSYATPAWMLPAGTNADGDRVSIVRVSDRMGLIDGLKAGAWRSFDMSSHLNAPESTYYGNRNDLSSPGYTIDGVLPVSLSKFRPERLATGEVVVRWATESETNNAGFNILRGEALDGEFTKLNEQLIAGKGTTSEKNSYEFVDTSAKPNVVYYYQIQDVSLDGDVTTLRTTHLRGNISVVGKLTTTWGELKALQ